MSHTAYLRAATEVGDVLIKSAIADKHKMYWRVVDKLENRVHYESDNLYVGGSGIGLFFLELYKHTRDQTYLTVARKAIRTAATRERSKPVQADFIVGRMGIAYALMRLHQVTGAQTYRTQALAMAKSCRHAYSEAHEYLGGNAGILLSVLHLHAVCKEPWLLEMANDYAWQLLRGIHPDTTGIYWDRYPFQIRPLCGFSHGAAGIGFAFLAAGRYLNNPAYYAIAEQAFAYENAFFDKNRNNWPDFRLRMWKPKQITAMKAAYLKDDLGIFTKAENMAVWCHGAPGIGLSRILAYQVTGKPTYQQDINRATLATKDAKTKGASLCHGLAGNLEIFIENYLAFGHAADQEQVRNFGEALLAAWSEERVALDAKEEQLDLGLFTGVAGVGYALLRLHDPRLTPSILAPQIPTTISEEPDVRQTALRITTSDVPILISGEDATGPAVVTQLKRTMRAHYPSGGLLFVKQLVHQKMARELLKLSDDQLLDRVLQYNDDCRMHMLSATSGVLLMYTPTGIEQKDISRFCYTVLSAFQRPQTIAEALDAVCKKYGIVQSDHREILHAKSLEQIRQALAALVLLSP